MSNEEFDPEVYEFYKAALKGPGFDAPFTVNDINWLREDEVKRHAANTDPYEVLQTYEKFIPRDDADPLMVRIYIPDGVKRKEKSAPVILYFHGGGFVMGCVEDHDPLCGKLADSCGAVVISVEYRLAPEYPFPACIDDAVCAANWAYEHAADFGGDREKLMAGGDSSGANICAALALLAKEGKAPELSYLILFYGVYGSVDLKESESAKKYGQGGFVLPVNAMNEMMKIYTADGADPDDIRLNPGRAEDLTGFPPSLIVTAEFDTLRSDSEEFAKRLRNAGNDVEYIMMDGMMHGFILYWQRFHRAKELIEEIGDKVKAL
ncbi:MAG: alpha/beta hydrolase [Eubacterium sp.]|nr:alpha/beta hydrolase [Eubacterium sp.]